MTDLLSLVLGLACAGVGGELFVRGIVGVAAWARVSPGIVAATFAAFATSSPELTVAVNSALAGSPEISLGDALGSNVVNVALILGIAMLVAPAPAARENIRRDVPAAMLAPLAVGVLAYDGSLSRLDGAILLGVFLIWLVAVVIEARRQRGAATSAVLGEHRPRRALVYCLAGLALLVVAGHWIVHGALGIAKLLGIDTFAISATLVALGTSVPELATSLISQWRGHGEVTVGTILGSNVFNGLFIIGVASTLHPIPVEWHAVALTLLFGAVTVAISPPLRAGRMHRLQGGILVACYLLYIAILF